MILSCGALWDTVSLRCFFFVCFFFAAFSVTWICGGQFAADTQEVQEVLYSEQTIIRPHVGLELLQVQVCCWLGKLPWVLCAGGHIRVSETSSLNPCRL